MSDRRHYEWAYPTREYRLEEDDQGHYFMSAIDPRDGQGVTVRVVDNELADRVLILGAENAELRKMPTESLKDFLEADDAALARARSEGRLEGMQDVLRELVRHGHQGGATFVVRELIAAERELEQGKKA